MTLEALRAKGLGTRKGIPVKILARGELTKALTVHAHGFSATARERIEAAGGTCDRRRGVANHLDDRVAMIATILSAFTVPEIRKKLAFTALLLALYRLGSHIPVPGVNLAGRQEASSQLGGSNILGFLNLFSGGGLSRIALFALGIMPYITASIILQLLQVVVPSLEKLSEGGRGRAGADHAVHALPDGRPGVRPVDRLRLPVPLARAPAPAGESSRPSTPRTSS